MQLSDRNGSSLASFQRWKDSNSFPTLRLKKLQVEEKIEEESELQTGLLGMLQTGCRIQTQRRRKTGKRRPVKIICPFNGASSEQRSQVKKKIYRTPANPSGGRGGAVHTQRQIKRKTKGTETLVQLSSPVNKTPQWTHHSMQLSSDLALGLHAGAADARLADTLIKKRHKLQHDV